MSTFVTVYDAEQYKERGFANDAIIDWGEYSNAQQAANLSAELMSRWTWDTPVQLTYRTERGGSAGGYVFNVVMAAKKDDIRWIATEPNANDCPAVPVIGSGTWKKEPKWKPESKGLVLIGGFQPSPYAKFKPKEFKEWVGVAKDSDEGQRLCRDIPTIADSIYFGCRRGKRTKEIAVEMAIRFMGPGETWDTQEAKRRLFINGQSRWTLFIFEMDEAGNLVKESRDLWEEAKRFYGTDDLKKMKSLNTWAISRERAEAKE